MTADFDVQPLHTKHRARLERLIRRIPRSIPYAGRIDQVEMLQRAEAALANLSLGLFDGSALAGYILAVRGNTRAQLAGFGVATLPEELPHESALVLDSAVTPHARKGAAKLFLRFGQMLRERDDLRTLPLCFVCSGNERARLIERTRTFRHFGFGPARRMNLGEPGDSQPLHALVFERQAQPVRTRPRALRDALRSVCTYGTSGGPLEFGAIETTSDWSLLEPHWNRLLAATDGATVFQSYEYQRTWWAYLGSACDLWIIVGLRNGTPVIIAPLQISLLRWLGDDLRCLSFIGSAPESDRPRLLAADASSDELAALAGYLVAHFDRWDHLFLAEQNPGAQFENVLTQELRSAGYLVLRQPGLTCPIVSLDATWQEFLSSRTRAVRKSIKRRDSRLAAAGTPGFENAEPHGSTRQPFDRYLAVEQASWKAGTTVGVAASSTLIAFYRRLLDQFAASGQVQFHFLSLDGRTIAATFGLIWNDCFYSLHVAHDEAYAELSPGVILTGRELQEAFGRRRFRTFDFLSGTLANKTSWATSLLPSVDLLCTRGAIRGWLFHWIYFRLKPRAKALLLRWRFLARIREQKAAERRHAGDDDADAD